jgi:hypothetical protein
MGLAIRQRCAAPSDKLDPSAALAISVFSPRSTAVDQHRRQPPHHGGHRHLARSAFCGLIVMGMISVGFATAGSDVPLHSSTSPPAILSLY